MAYMRMGLRAAENFEERFRAGYRYSIDRVHENGTRYMICCSRRHLNCRGRLIIYANGDCRTTREHNHIPNPNDKYEFMFRLALFNAVTTRFENPRYIYDEIAVLHSEGALEVPYNEALQATIRRWRRNVRPPTPGSFTELIDFLTSGDWRNSLSMGRTSFTTVAVGDVGERSAILYDATFIRKFESTDSLMVDGTFGTIPRIDMVLPPINDIAQLYIIMGTKYDCVIPLFWVFMESRTRNAYEQVFSKIKQLMPHLRPTIIMSDFERAAQDALHSIFPNSMLHGCYFHYVKALSRKLQSMTAVMRFVRSNDEGKLFIEKLKVIPLLPPEIINETYTELIKSLSPDSFNVLRPFILYFERQWIRNVGVQVLSVYGMLRRTNNNCEALNRILRDRMGQHRGLWVFLRNLLQLQARFSTDLANLQINGRARNAPLLQYLIDTRVLVVVWNSIEEGRMTVNEGIEVFINNIKNVSDIIHQYYNVPNDEVDVPPENYIEEEENAENQPAHDVQFGNNAIVQPNEGIRTWNPMIPLFDVTNDGYDRMCIICRNTAACIIFIPCKHLISCASCFNIIVEFAEVAGHRARCPYCRNQIMEPHRVKMRLLDFDEPHHSPDVPRTHGIHDGFPIFADRTNHFDYFCQICRRQESNVFFRPCGHLATCATCANLLTDEAENERRQVGCPVCEAIVNVAHLAIMPGM